MARPLVRERHPAMPFDAHFPIRSLSLLLLLNIGPRRPSHGSGSQDHGRKRQTLREGYVTCLQAF